MFSEEKARKRIALIWYGGGGFVFLFVVAQTILGRNAEISDQIWSWLLPAIMPSLSLITGVLVVKKASTEINASGERPDPFVFRLACILSVIYLLIILSIFLSQPFDEENFVNLLKKSSMWLAPLQGLVTASLGAFFVQKKSN
jgi:hypothetical protein